MKKNKNKVHIFNKALNWIYNNSIDNNGITVTSKEKRIYPEVTGYYIPSLLQWGERDLAVSYAKYLCTIQKNDGSWYDSHDKNAYVFDSAQILKGLIAIRDIVPEVDSYIERGCEWILSNMDCSGRLTTPSKDAWGKREDFCSELIHLYCLTPIKDAGEIFKKPQYGEAVRYILEYYKKEKIDKIENFSLLSHFYAYVMEGLFDLGETELCRKSMSRLEEYRNSKDGIPGLKDVTWVCSTGMFQLALVWYKLGELERGNSLFNYAASLQNESGGWYGSYPGPSVFSLIKKKGRPYYFPDSEISWANKYFLDALALKEQLEFEKQSSSFIDEIDESDGRYNLLWKLLNIMSVNGDSQAARYRVIDVGCGKGRYLKRLQYSFPQNEYYAVDLSENVMKGINCVKEKKSGSLTCIPYEKNYFDFVYACESFEHSINLRGAFKELFRIAKAGGIIVIIDKPQEKLGQLDIYEWEQWIRDEDMIKFAEECGGKLEIEESVSYEGKNDGLFRAWIVKKRNPSFQC